ncbi:ubiquitin carboxyl-terminal hydrolase isozyme L3 isoform X1 [Hydra vulgaris]|uniref:Ubiquitin carboxyl-terminal hydrolase n=1 Tax=Hydra vulgaris TaxID=6087 RepID=T2MHC2_HYDVU|nr:ubiquitin carboxyl-terminal hydrolase isozyme L3 [Hydra vulgaris]
MIGDRWLPLESNPDVMNRYIKALGVDTDKWKFVDVYGLDDELLEMVPHPACAILLLFPINSNYEKNRIEEEEKVRSEGQFVSSCLYFMPQTISNACGTLGVIHAIANNMEVLQCEGLLKAFIEQSKDLSLSEKALMLQNDSGITSCHDSSALEGQTLAPSREESVNLHFIALVQKEGYLYELDGRRPFPINHGRSNEETFLKDAAIVCKKFMEFDKESLQFNVVALAKVN